MAKDIPKDILRELQSRIDKNANAIAEAISQGHINDIDKEARKDIYDNQAFDKRLYGYIVSLKRRAYVAEYLGYEER